MLIACGLLPWQASATLILSPDGITVYDTVNNISWLADTNLAATNQFGIPVCNGPGTQVCVNASGSMRYDSATAWVAAMNAANYLGHTNWQLPTTPANDSGCGRKGPTGQSFGFGCAASAFGAMFNALGLKPPHTAVPVPTNTVGPFSNFQPYLYWSQSGAPPPAGNYTFSFGTGWQGANTLPNLLYVLPMIPGKMPGTPPTTGSGLQANPGGQTVYDPVTNITWLANANLAASNTFGLPACTDPLTPALCADPDGAMTLASANQYIANMNGARYLGQTNWQLPAIEAGCSNYNCAGNMNPMGNLFYAQLGFSQGMSVVTVPDIAVGPFRNIQPYLYWTCMAATIQSACQTDGPAPNFEWSYSFGSGFEGTDLLANDLYVTAYFLGPPPSASGPEILEVANAEGESPSIAPNTWVEIRGVKLAPSADAAGRIWAGPDFVNNQMPKQLDGVSATVNGKNAYVYYVSPGLVNILTPPDAMSGAVQVVVSNNGVQSAAFTAQAQVLSPSFFVFPGAYVAARHLDGSLIGPPTLYPGFSTPVRPGDIVELYANGFGPSSLPVVSGSINQSGILPASPVIRIGGLTAQILYAGLVAPGEFQFNVVIPGPLANGDQSITATYSGVSTQPGTLITIQH